jgi:hypothetical protein
VVTSVKIQFAWGAPGQQLQEAATLGQGTKENLWVSTWGVAVQLGGPWPGLGSQQRPQPVP